MFNELKKSLASWKASYDDRQKLQHCYVVLSLIVVLVSGVISLFNQDLGQSVLLVAVALAGIFVINAVIWSWIESGVLSKIGRRSSK